MSAFSSPWRAALSGAGLAFTASLVYGLIFSIFASLRSSLRILQILKPGENLGMSLVANATSIFIVSIEFAILFGILAAIIQGLCWMAVSGISRWMNLTATWVGLGISFLIVAVLHLLLWSSTGILHALIWRTPSAYLFWLGLPSLIFIGLTVLTANGLSLSEALKHVPSAGAITGLFH